MNWLRRVQILVGALTGALTGLAISLGLIVVLGALMSAGSGLVGLFYPLALILGVSGGWLGVKLTTAVTNDSEVLT